MDIKEIAERYTREEWLKLSMRTKKELLIDKGNCPNGSGLKTLHCCTDSNITICDETCIECWRQAIKDIKFKDEVWVKCINDLGSKNLTLNKEYMVITQGETWIEIVNDSNTNYSYLMYGFKKIKEDEKSERVYF